MDKPSALFGAGVTGQVGQVQRALIAGDGFMKVLVSQARMTGNSAIIAMLRQWGYGQFEAARAAGLDAAGADAYTP